jgi:hypothetical protein
MEQTREYIIYIVWETEIIEANHGGYCSGADNEEEIYEDRIICEYIVNKNEYDIFIWICNEVPVLVSEDIFINIMMPSIPNKPDFCSGSGYCDPSIHGLRHEKQTTFIKILDYSHITPLIAAKTLKCDSFSLKQYLKPIIATNKILLNLQDIFPLEVINEIAKYVWNTYSN